MFASSLISKRLACHAVLVSNIFSRHRRRMRATRHEHKTSSLRAGHKQMAGARRRVEIRLDPLREGVGGATCESVFRSNLRAISRIDVPRPQTYTPSRDESNRVSPRTQDGSLAEKMDDKDPYIDEKSARRAEIAQKRARQHK